MRSNSGKDESRSNMHDPTTRDRTEEQSKKRKSSPVSHGKASADHRQGRKD